MSPFPGFPLHPRYVAIPEQFITAVMAEITDLAELKAMLAFFRVLGQKRGSPRFVTLKEVLAQPALMRRVGDGRGPETAVRVAVGRAVTRGVLLELAVDGQPVYLLNGPREREAVEQIHRGSLSLSGKLPDVAITVPPQAEPDIFTLYEQNVGVLTPIIAEQLMEAEKTFPSEWIHEAFREAVQRNRRNWRYILRVLERWMTEGRQDGTTGGHSQAAAATERFLGGKYGHLVQH